MDPALITALTGVLLALGGGTWKLIQRADARREKRETSVEALLKERCDSFQAQIDSAKAQYERERKDHSRMKATAGKWREQLIANGITPDPANWPEAH